MSTLNGKLISGMTLRLIGIVALSVVAVVAAEPAAAEHCKGNHKNDPGCEAAGTTLGDLSCTIDQIAKYDGAAWVCSDVSEVRQGPKTVFVTSSGGHTGQVRDLQQADELCQLNAERGIVPPGIYIAWLSLENVSSGYPVKHAIDRLPDNASGYFLPSGIKVADDKLDLVTCDVVTGDCLQHEIDEDEFGRGLGGINEFVWTGTSEAGEFDGVDCAHWTDGGAGSQGTAGSPFVVDQGWTRATRMTCDESGHLYCFQR